MEKVTLVIRLNNSLEKLMLPVFILVGFGLVGPGVSVLQGRKFPKGTWMRLVFGYFGLPMSLNQQMEKSLLLTFVGTGAREKMATCKQYVEIFESFKSR